MTVVGLFDEMSDAKAAQQELSRADFGDNTQFLHGSAADVQGELTNHQIPEGDIRLYEQGVQTGDSLLVVHTNDTDRAEQARQIMNRYDAMDIHHAGHVRTARTMGTPVSVAVTTVTDRTVNAGEAVTVPVIEEELVIGKREIQRGGAQIRTTVIEKPASETVTLREESVVVDRHPVNRPVSQAELDAALTERTIEVTKHDEVAVVGKTAHIVEEVTVGKTATERTQTVTDTVRRTDVDVVETGTIPTPPTR